MDQLNSTRQNFIFEIIIHKYRIGLMIDGKLVCLQEEDQKEDISIVLIFEEQFFTSALFKDTQDVMSLILCYKTMSSIIQRGLFQHNYRKRCAFNFHSMISNGLIFGGLNASRRQTIFFLPIDPRDKDHQDLEQNKLSVPRLARHLHSAWKKHQFAVFFLG